MSSPFTNFPQSPPRGARVAQVIAPPTNPTDIGRAIDLLIAYMIFDARIHPADLMELQQLSAIIKASSNNQ